MARVDTELTQAALDCARTAFGGVSIVATATLRDRPGWSVERLALVTGTGASVADRLMGDDPGEATAAVQRWAEAVARIQAATLRMGTDFRSRLAALAATARPDGGADVYRDR